jgi:hypothetical protein
MLVRIVVADQSEACFYDTKQPEHERRFAGHLTDPLAHLPAAAFLIGGHE